MTVADSFQAITNVRKTASYLDRLSNGGAGLSSCRCLLLNFIHLYVVLMASSLLYVPIS